MDDLTTWGQALDYTIKTRDSWQPHRSGSKPAITYASHFTTYNSKGRRFLISNFNKAEMESYINDLRVYRELSDQTLNHCIQNIQTPLNHCIDMGVVPYQNNRHAWITGEGKFKFTKLRLTKQPKITLTPGQVDQFYSAARGTFNQEPLADTIMVSAWTGMGWAEFSQLTSVDIHLDAPVPFISLGEREGWTLKTAYRKRRIYLPVGSDGYERVVPILRRNLESCTDPSIQVFGDMFTSQDAHRVKFNDVRDYLQLPEKLTPYCLRHTFCTWLANMDVHPAKAHKMMGHSSMKTTMEYYTHINDDQIIDAYSRLTAAA
tara:strand:+ start:352 stop:1305 length:954 start_codon:yes stop_codon:yes gene_type:complete